MASGRRGDGLCALAVLMILKRWRRLPALAAAHRAGYRRADHLAGGPPPGVGLVGEIDVQFRAVGVPGTHARGMVAAGRTGLRDGLRALCRIPRQRARLCVDARRPDLPGTANSMRSDSAIVSGLFGGLPVGAGYSGTSANEAAGASLTHGGLGGSAGGADGGVHAASAAGAYPATRARGGGHQRRKPFSGPALCGSISAGSAIGWCSLFAIAAVLLLASWTDLLWRSGASLLLTPGDLSWHRCRCSGALARGTIS